MKNGQNIALPIGRLPSKNSEQVRRAINEATKKPRITLHQLERSTSSTLAQICMLGQKPTQRTNNVPSIVFLLSKTYFYWSNPSEQKHEPYRLYQQTNILNAFRCVYFICFLNKSIIRSEHTQLEGTVSIEGTVLLSLRTLSAQ